MTRRRWVYTSGGEPLPEPIEVSEDWSNVTPRAPVATEEMVYGKLQATDGTDLSSRKKHRDYMKREGLALMHEMKGEHERLMKERQQIMEGTHGPTNAARREALREAIQELNSRRRR